MNINVPTIFLILDQIQQVLTVMLPAVLLFVMYATMLMNIVLSQEIVILVISIHKYPMQMKSALGGGLCV